MQLTSPGRTQVLHFVLVVAALIVVNGYLALTNGVRVVVDSERYLEYATRLKSGFYVDPYNIWYFGYSLFILTIKSIGGGLTAIVSVQYALFFLATLALYRTSLLVWESSSSALITALTFVGFVDVPLWNGYILPESLYVSFTCFSVYMLARLAKGQFSMLLLALTCLVVLFTISIKPTGIALLGACAAVVAWKLVRRSNIPLVRWAIYSVTALAIIILANRMLENYLIMENYALGEVIYRVSAMKGSHPIEGLIVTPPEDLYIPSQESAPIMKMLAVAIHHPIYWTQLFFTKAFYLLFHVRPYWSTGHNLLSLLFLFPAYCLGTVAFLRGKVSVSHSLFAVVFLTIHVMAVCLTSEDWDGRFLIPMLPIVFLLAGRGAALSGDWMYGRRRQE